MKAYLTAKLALWFLILAVTLTGCSTSPGEVNDVHTGVRGFHSEQHQALNGLLRSVNVVAIAGKKNDAWSYGVGTTYLGTGRGWQFFDSAWSFGRQLEFEVTNRKVLGCMNGCTHLEEGVIKLTREEFLTASRNGLQFKLVGKNGSETVTVPPFLFIQVINQMQSAGLG